ncbi:hypothetical protein MMC30_005221 [Trapelia coarctata]|nr:hypothetical protein [Trapelia coarctata]
MDDDHQALGKTSAGTLCLESLPEIYVLPGHGPQPGSLSQDELHDLEEKLSKAGASLTYDIFEARLVLGAVSTARRAQIELNWLKLRTEQVNHGREADRNHSLLDSRQTLSVTTEKTESPAKKRRKLNCDQHEDYSNGIPAGNEATSRASETEDDDDAATTKTMSQLSISHTDATALSSDPIEPEDTIIVPEFPEDHVKVIRIDWFRDSEEAGVLRPMEQYLVYEGRILGTRDDENKNEHQKLAKDPQDAVIHNTVETQEHVEHSAPERAYVPDQPTAKRYGKRAQIENALRRDFYGRSFASSSQQTGQKPVTGTARPVHFLRETTSEHDEGVSRSLPQMPEWVKKNKIYACERSTPLHTPNDDFIGLLKKIKLARVLTGDDIGVRAYSTSIASIAAYPYKLSNTNEILHLPGCDEKIAHLFYEWETTGHIQAVDDIEADPVLTTLEAFYNIYGVGAKIARQFYYDKGWRELDDIIENGWHLLNREQQIGLKFYDDFQLKIPRSEVEYIASVATYHAKRIVDERIECIIVGGYRRGRTENGDVDIILTHREESATRHLITPVVEALEHSGWITHTLSVLTTNSDRDQQPVRYKFASERPRHGFDTLDKALVVWQDPNWPSRADDVADNPKAKNPNPHRRVDIIITPWRTVGCAVEGWTSGTTFQRDLRRYAKHAKGWKFDSSGVRERGTGKWLDVEKWTDVKTRAKTWQEAERRVFDGMGLEWREPWERNTG